MLARRSHPGYLPGEDRPAHDPAYVDRVADALLAHLGKRVHLESVVGGDPWSVHEAVECLRRLGWQIEGERGVAGYVCLGWRRPRRWLRLDSVYKDHQRAILLGPRRRRIAVMPGQLAIGEEE